MPEKRTGKSASQRWAEKNPELTKAYAEKALARNRLVLAEELEKRGGTCVYPGCQATKVEWHHRDAATKNFAISTAVRGRAISTLLSELSLCDPLCRKHHMLVDGRTVTARRRVKANPPRGEKNPRAFLTEKDVIDIRSRCGSGEPRMDLANEYGITYNHVSMIVRRKIWKALA